jgi:hypothetical protein
MRCEEIMNDEKVRSWKKADMTYLKVLTMNSLEETYENHEKPVIIAGRPAEI